MIAPTAEQKQILVVEDESIIGMEIQARLTKLGYRTPHLVHSGLEAIKIASESHPNLVLMDISLQGEMDGIEAAHIIADRYDIPIIFLTANTDESTFQRAKIASPFGYLLKPFEERQLHSAIEIALYKAAMDKELRCYRENLEMLVKERTEDLLATNSKLQEEIVQHEKTALALKASEENYKTIFNKASDGIIVQAIDSTTIYDANLRICEMFGVSYQEVCSMSISDLSYGIPPYTEKEALDYIKKAAAGETQVFEWLAKNKKGEPIWLEISLNSTTINGKECLLAISRDIGTRKEEEQALIKAKEAAEQADRTKSEFLTNISHEVRTPLNHILGMTNLALDTELTDKQRHYLEIVKTAGTSLTNILSDIIELSQIEAGHIELHNGNLDIREIVTSTTNSFKEYAANKGLELSCQIAPEVPNNLKGDAVKLQQILTNFVSNALKFTQAGSILIAVHAPKDNDTNLTIPFSITDTGIGIPQEKQENIFGKFNQADGSTTRKYGGIGLGLTIVNKLVLLMGGDISIESVEGEGSTFHFTISCPKG